MLWFHKFSYGRYLEVRGRYPHLIPPQFEFRSCPSHPVQQPEDNLGQSRGFVSTA